MSCGVFLCRHKCEPYKAIPGTSRSKNEKN